MNRSHHYSQFWPFYTDYVVENPQQQILLPILKILEKYELLLVEEYTRGVHKRIDSRNIIEDIERGDISIDDGFYRGVSKVFTENGDYISIREPSVITFELSWYDNKTLRAGIDTDVDIWTPINYEDYWQVKSAEVNMERLESALKEMEQVLKCKPDEYDDIMRGVGSMKYQYRLYNYPEQIENALEYDNENTPKDFDTKSYYDLSKKLDSITRSKLKNN